MSSGANTNAPLHFFSPAERGGVIFIDADSRGGPGVRLK